MTLNRVKDKIARNESAVGCMMGIYSPALVEIAGYAGYDFVVLDDEHGAFDWVRLEEMIRVASLVGLVPIVRTDYNPSSIQKVLDRGALGIQVPMVNSREDAIRVVERAKYPPAGKRGTAFSTRAAGYGFHGGLKFMDESDRSTLVVVHIETAEAVENFEEIVSVPGIDIAFIGPLDLCVSMGYKAEGIEHPAVQETIKGLYEKAKRLNVPIGTIASTKQEVATVKEHGASFVAVVATNVMKSAFRSILE